MTELIVTCNTGSSNIKIAVYEEKTMQRREHIKVESIQQALEWIKNLKNEKIVSIGHRIVHGGEKFHKPVIITREVIKDLLALVPLAPLHQPAALELIKSIHKLLPKIKQVGCFDTAFHKTTPQLEKLTGLPFEYYQQGIERYGFHGISYQYIASILPQYDQDAHRKRIIIAHLGGGSSMCALHKLQSLATTMGFSTLEGLIMGTRTGSLDPGIILYLLEQNKMRLSEVTDLLYNRSGLLGLSGISPSMQTLLKNNEPRAKEAVDLYCYQAAKQLGSLITVAGGIDTLVFTGGVGENSGEIRFRICQYLKWLGLGLNSQNNNSNALLISSEESKVAVYALPTDEEAVIAQSAMLATSV